jgi:hypothetical protein
LFNISGIVSKVGASAIGKTLYLYEVSNVLNDKGDSTSTKTQYSIDGVVQIVSSEDDEVKEGILSPQDIICFFDETETNLAKLVSGNQIYYDTRYYRIKEVISEIGHVEVHAKKM